MKRFFRIILKLKGAIAKLQLGLVTCLILNGCGGDVLISEGENGIDHIPLKSGSTWSYARFDSLAVMEDTVIVNIIGQGLSIQGDTLIEIEVVDSIISIINAKMVSDTLLFIISDFGLPYVILERFVLPLKVGNQWLGKSLFDSVSVVGRETVEVPAGVFHDAFRVEQRFWFFNQSNQTTYWIAPGVGIVKKNVHNFGFSENKIESWNLLSYSIPE